MEYTLYKPTKKQTGGAIKFNLHKTGKFSFMKAAPQIAAMGSSKVFGWDDEDSINVKMNLSDLGAFLAVIEGYMPEAKLFHKTDVDNKIITFIHSADRGGYSLNISHARGSSDPRRVFVGINYPEVMALKVYIENTIREMLVANVWTGE